MAHPCLWEPMASTMQAIMSVDCNRLGSGPESGKVLLVLTSLCPKNLQMWLQTDLLLYRKFCFQINDSYNARISASQEPSPSSRPISPAHGSMMAPDRGRQVQPKKQVESFGCVSEPKARWNQGRMIACAPKMPGRNTKRQGASAFCLNIRTSMEIYRVLLAPCELEAAPQQPTSEKDLPLLSSSTLPSPSYPP